MLLFFQTKNSIFLWIMPPSLDKQISTHAVPVKPTCSLAKPIYDCEVAFAEATPLFNTSVDLSLSFRIKAPLDIGDTVDVAFAGFKADFANTYGKMFHVHSNLFIFSEVI
jgi:hypothetical protein